MLTLLLLSLLGSTLAGNLFNPYVASTGISYSSYSTAHGPLAHRALASATPLAANHLAYAAAPAVATYAAAAPVVAAPVAATYAAAPVAAATYAAAPVAAATYATAPVATYAAAPVATYAAHAPVAVAAPASVAVPVTRVSAQPAVLQNVVDVAHPKLATRRIEIRRPAIQKQFYDIEERVVVRPAGSAVVELDTPVSANQRGATQVSHAVHAYAPTHGVHLASPAYGSYYPGLIAHHPQVHEQGEDVEQISQEEQQELQQQQQLQQQNIQQQIDQQQQLQQQEQQIGPQPQPIEPEQQPQPQFDSSDSVEIENPELARSGIQQRVSQNIESPLFRAELSQLRSQQNQLQQQQQQQNIQQQQQQSNLARNNLQISQLQLERSQLRQYPQFLQLPQFAQYQQLSQPQSLQASALSQISQIEGLFRSQNLQQQQQISNEQQQQISNEQQQQISNEQQPDLSLARAQRPLLTPRPEISARQGPTSQPIGQLRASQRSEIISSYNSGDVIPSVRNLSPEQSQLNQDRLIELLTGRGPVAEVRSANEPIRARVISATPAPPNAEPTDSQVNTRRVVVSRPIQTVQEVDVVQPFTKIERVAVHQPAVVKTAHVELAHVPAVHAVHAVTPVPLTAHYI